MASSNKQSISFIVFLVYKHSTYHIALLYLDKRTSVSRVKQTLTSRVHAIPPESLEFCLLTVPSLLESGMTAILSPDWEYPIVGAAYGTCYCPYQRIEALYERPYMVHFSRIYFSAINFVSLCVVHYLSQSRYLQYPLPFINEENTIKMFSVCLTILNIYRKSN